MSGFLHQLAVRSLGLAPQIKSRAALPYAAPPADFRVAESSQLESLPAAPAIERQELPAPVPATRRSDRTTENPQPAPIVAVQSERAPRVAREAPHPEADTASQPPRVSRSPGPEGSRLEITPDKLTTQRPVDAISRPAMAAFNPAQQLPEPESPRFGAETQARFPDLETLVARLLRDGPNQPGRSSDNAPPPVAAIPRTSGQRPEATSTIRSQASRERPTIAAENDTTPEVHITIGRLEVNPPSRPAPAALPPRPRGPAPLSLCDYLARRGGRS